MASTSRKLLREIIRPRKPGNGPPGGFSSGEGAAGHPHSYSHLAGFGQSASHLDTEGELLLQRLSKSASTSSVTGSNLNSSQPLDGSMSAGGVVAFDQASVLALVQDVKCFTDNVCKLRSAIQTQPATTPSPSTATPSTPFADEAATLLIRERLGETLTTLKTVINKYPMLNSGDVLTCAGQLIGQVKGFDCSAKDAADSSKVYESIDMLALAFSRSVTEYLMGDLEVSFKTPQCRAGSYENLNSNGNSTPVLDPTTASDVPSYSELDDRLFSMEAGVDHALERAKAWSKYAKDVIGYVEKRTSLEAEFSKNLSKLAHLSRPSIMENSFQPFQSTFVTAVDQDVEYANTSSAACNIIITQKFVEPLLRCRSDYDKQRKVIRDTWLKGVKRMNDGISNMKKAKVIYDQRCQEYEKAKESAKGSPTDALSSSAGMMTLKAAEKKKKLEEESYQKAMDAETVYKTCVHEANSRQKELVKVKEAILRQTRELMLQCEQTMKSAMTAYFQLQHAVTATVPGQYQMLHEECRSYEPGDQYAQYVRRLPAAPHAPHDDARDTFVFEQYVPESHQQRISVRKSSSHSHDSGVGSPGDATHVSSSVEDYKFKPTLGSLTANINEGGSESESHSSENKSRDSSPSASPRNSHKRVGSDTQSLSASLDGQGASATFKGNTLSRAATGHVLRRLRAPSRCRACDSYVYFQGAECEKCDLTCHNKCLETLVLPCIGHRQTLTPAERQKMNTFGVAFDDHVRHANVDVPVIISRCIEEIDERGLEMRGIYRVSGVKSKVEKLCQSFENGGEGSGGDDDLSKQHPSVISNVLKLYLRQLPEPLLTVHLYHDFVTTAKEHASGACSDKHVVSRLKEITQRLPRQNYATTRLLMYHLRRVSLMEDENQMNACNLGIVFGPTLLRSNCDEGTASLMTLIDTPHQARTIELLIRLAEEIFGPDEKMADRIVPVEVAKKSPRDIDSLSSGSSSSSRNFKSVNSNNLTEEIMHALDGRKDYTSTQRQQAASSPDSSRDLSGPREDLSSESDSDEDVVAEAANVSAVMANAAAGRLTLPLEHRAVMRSSSSPFPAYRFEDDVCYVDSTGSHDKIDAVVSTVAPTELTYGGVPAGSQPPSTVTISATVTLTSQTRPLAMTSQSDDGQSSLKAFDKEVASGKALYGASFDAIMGYSLTLPKRYAGDGDVRSLALSKSASATRVVFYSDVDSTLQLPAKSADSQLQQNNKSAPVPLQSCAQHTLQQTDCATNKSRTMYYAQSMKRKSDEPKFV